MLSAAAIKRLADQVGALEDRAKPRNKVVFVIMGEGMDKDAVFARHYELFPEDSNPDVEVCTVYERHPDLDLNPWIIKSTRAWWELVAEGATK